MDQIQALLYRLSQHKKTVVLSAASWQNPPVFFWGSMNVPWAARSQALRSAVELLECR
jgi:hypothetical protein